MSYKIITDSGCDLPGYMIQELDLLVCPLSVLYKGVNYTEYTEQWLKEMFDGLRSGETASTSAINPQGWRDYMEPVLKEGQDALVITFTSGMSTTYQSAVIAHVFDQISFLLDL